MYPLMHWHWPSMHRPRPEQSAISHSSWRRLHSLPFQPGWHWHSPFWYSPWPPQSIGQAPKAEKKVFIGKKVFWATGRSATTNELKFPLELDLFQNSSFTWLRTYSIEAHTWVLSDKPLQNVFFSDRNRAGNSISSFIWRDPCHFITVLGIT